jgi:phosphonate transport system permease protein
MFAKKLVFDTLFFAYSAGLLIYLGTLAMGHPITQDVFIRNFIPMGEAALALLIVLAGSTVLLPRFKIRTIGDLLFSKFVLGEEAERPFYRRFATVHLLIVFGLTLFVSFRVTESSLFDLLDSDGLQGAIRLWSGLSHPNLELLPKAIAQATETVFIAFLATTLAIPFAFVFAFFCAKNVMTAPAALPFYGFFRLILNVVRSVEPLIWALIFTVWVGVGPFAGMLALLIHSVASLTKYYSEIIENVSEGPVDAVRSTGAGEIQTVWFAILPQVILPYIAMTVYRWDTNVRMATVIGLVGGGGIGTLLIQYQGQAMWPEVGCIILVIAAAVWAMDTASAYLREALK